MLQINRLGSRAQCEWQNGREKNWHNNIHTEPDETNIVHELCLEWFVCLYLSKSLLEHMLSYYIGAANEG